jgi:hypothetical protein
MRRVIAPSQALPSLLALVEGKEEEKKRAGEIRPFEFR